MRASKEIRMALNRLRRRYAGRNGVISCGLLDIPWMERQSAKDAKTKLRRKGMWRRAHDAEERT